ncbi:MAG: hypothetical protein WAU00_02875 [Caldilinea sp.]|jgi:hypothetical protein|nr:hypothetical protein [Caldilinea sp.]
MEEAPGCIVDNLPREGDLLPLAPPRSKQHVEIIVARPATAGD